MGNVAAPQRVADSVSDHPTSPVVGLPDVTQANASHTSFAGIAAEWSRSTTIAPTPSLRRSLDRVVTVPLRAIGVAGERERAISAALGVPEY